MSIVPPGVNVTTGLRSGPATTPAPDLATWFVLGGAPLGPVNTPMVFTDAASALQVFDPAILSSVYGNNASATAAFRAALRSFFEEGGQRLVFSRITGGDAEAAALTLLDADDDPSLTITAASVGEWGNLITVAVAAGTAGGTKKITVSTVDDAGIGSILSEPVVVDNLANKAAVVAAFRGVNDAVKAAIGLDLYTVTEGEGLTPDNLATTPLAGGDDDAGNPPVMADVMPDAGFGPGALSFTAVNLGLMATLPQITADAVALALDARRILIVDAGLAEGLSPADVADVVEDLRTGLEDVDKHGRTVEEILGAIVLVPMVAAQQDGLTAYTSGMGYVAGVRARTIAGYGPHRAPAGDVSDARYIDGPVIDATGTVNPVSDTLAAALYGAGVNPIRIIGGKVRLYGWRTLAAPDSEWFSASVADTLNGLAADADTRAESLMFRPIDTKGHLFAELRGLLTGLAEEAKAAGAIFPLVDGNGVEQDPGYSVDVSSNVNTPETIAAGQVNGVLNVRLAPNAATVNITVTKVAVGAAI